MRIPALIVLALAGLAACEKASTQSVVIGDLDRATMGEFEARMQRVMARPDVDKACDELLDAVAADPALAALGGELGDQLIADPVIAGAAEKLTASMGNSPTLMAWVQRYMIAHPDATPDAVGTAVGAEFEQRFERTYAKAVEDSIGRLVDDLDAGPGGAALAGRLEKRFNKAVTVYVEAPARRAAWGKRLVELNGGTHPDPTKAARLFVDNALTEDRLARFMVTLTGDPEVRRLVVAFLRRSLKEQTTKDQLHAAARTVAGDPAIQQAAIAAFELLLAETEDPAEARVRVDALFDSPAFRGAFAKLVHDLIADPTVQKIIDDTITDAARLDGVRKALDELIDGW